MMEKLGILVQIPSDYEKVYKTDNYVSYSKDDIDVTIKRADYYNSEDECLKEAATSYNYLKTQNNYNNVSITEKREMKVGSNSYSYKILSYDISMSGFKSSYTEYYMCTKIDDKMYYIFKMSASGIDITQDMLKPFLNKSK